jgi:hypothetical protein
VYSGFELIWGIGVGNVRLALCVRFTMIRNRFLSTILAPKRMFQSGRSSSIRYAGPSPQLAPSTNGNISVPTMTLLPNESPEQLARDQQATIQPMQS